MELAMKCPMCGTELLLTPRMEEPSPGVPLAPKLEMELRCEACGHGSTEALPMTQGGSEPVGDDAGMRTKEGRVSVPEQSGGQTRGLLALENETINRLKNGERAALEKELEDLVGYLDLVQQGHVAETLTHLRFLDRKEGILRRALTSRSDNDFMAPNSNRVLSPGELGEVAADIARRLGVFRGQYRHFDGFGPEEAAAGSFPIWYSHNVRYVDNPDYDRELREREASPPVKRPKPSEKVVVYPDDDSIELSIYVTEFEAFRTGQRCWQPDVWSCDHAVEMRVSGRDTDALAEIRDEIYGILLDVKKRFESAPRGEP